MNFSEDFILVQGILNNAYKTVGDFLEIKHRGGNESKIKLIVDDLRKVLMEKKYFRKGKINPKYESNLRQINLFLILNTDFDNKQIFVQDNKFAHLTDVTPQLSKCLLTNIVWGLELCRFYSEAIYSLPIEISVELLENVNKCINITEPYVVLEQVALIALAIYVKLYNIREEKANEEKVNQCISKFLEKYTQILRNYITPETEKMKSWPKSEMYQYMAVGIYKILYLLRCSFDVFLNKTPISEIHEIYQVNTSGPAYSPERLDKSGQALKKCNMCLMSVCEANLEVVTVDIFCSWAELTHNNAQLQQMIGMLAYEVRQQLDNFEGCGNLPHMLDAIKIKPKTIDEQIAEANENTLLNNVTVKCENQHKWIHAFLKHGVVSTTETFTVFESILNLCNEDHYSVLLEYNFEKKNNKLRDIILKNIVNLDDKVLVDIIAKYFHKTNINNVFETDNFSIQLGIVLNKMVSNTTNEEICIKDIVLLALQNPSIFLYQLMVESIKNPEQLTNIIRIIECIKPICDIEINKGPFLTEVIVKFLKDYDLNTKDGKLVLEFMNKISPNYLTVRNIIDELLELTEKFLNENASTKSVITLGIIMDLPTNVIGQCKHDDIFVKLADILSKTRWNFLTFSDEKTEVVIKTIKLIQYFNNYFSEETKNMAIEKLKDNPLNSYYISNSNTTQTFLDFCSPSYQNCIEHNHRVYHLLMILPCCTSEEWNSISDHLISKLSTIEILKIYTDVMLILSEITNKSKNLVNSLSYCFQQYCLQIKNIIHPVVNNNSEDYKLFITTILNLIKHLPKEIQNTNDLSLINLFNFDLIKTMINDNEFIYVLYSTSHLEICKVILSKLN